MPRPVSKRHIARAPGRVLFAPVQELEEVALAADEFEALRLADMVGLYQEDAAREMGISRATFGRIVTQARRKVATALVEGKAIRLLGALADVPGQKAGTASDGEIDRDA